MPRSFNNVQLGTGPAKSFWKSRLYLSPVWTIGRPHSLVNDGDKGVSTFTDFFGASVPDDDTTRQALERVVKEGCGPGLGKVIWHELDLKYPRIAKESAEHFYSRESRLDILSLITDLANPQVNADGIQINMAISHLGPFVFTGTLLPLLESTASLA
ncbi:hypothetical protein IW261DRAFT_1419566 [Armillaria novae-zelandiae]|uniref:Uncharacterized protein n=1 Tax=Armillaria novae-zelandiae TaxID=153914 RepID=A0AA39UBG0_9AGAR|nr:hypothetical protein IW261DRAFT_1419566 [Armillaria novae-zelandiae]